MVLTRLLPARTVTPLEDTHPHWSGDRARPKLENLKTKRRLPKVATESSRDLNLIVILKQPSQANQRHQFEQTTIMNWKQSSGVNLIRHPDFEIGHPEVERGRRKEPAVCRRPRKFPAPIQDAVQINAANLRDDNRSNSTPPRSERKVIMNLEPEWTVYRTRFLVRARQLTEPLVFTDVLGREQSGRPGDYLVESSDGMKRITSQALFEDIYVPLAPTPQASAPLHTTPKVQARAIAERAPIVLARPVSRASPEDRARATA